MCVECLVVSVCDYMPVRDMYTGVNTSWVEFVVFVDICVFVLLLNIDGCLPIFLRFGSKVCIHSVVRNIHCDGEGHQGKVEKNQSRG